MEKERNKILNVITRVFRKNAIEAHVFGSVARGDSDPYSDLDIWFTFKDTDIDGILTKRLEYYSQIGEVIHVCEPPQNSPVKGVHSFVLYKTSAGLLQVDFYLCPESSSFATKESRKIFGDVEIPLGKLEFNPQKILVPDSYRIDFFITFIFIAIKKLARNDSEALSQLFDEYQNLIDKYNISVEALINKENTYISLKQVIANIFKVSNPKQRATLNEVLEFISKVEKNQTDF